MKFRKKPVIIDAWQWDGRTQRERRPVWLQADLIEAGGGMESGQAVLHIPTLEGVMSAQPGDWIIRGVKGEIYPCKPDIFAATYESAE